MLLVPVTVTLEGRVVPSSSQATLVAGTVMASVSPFLDAIAVRYRIDASGDIAIEGQGRRLLLRIGDRAARLTLGGVSTTASLAQAPERRDGVVLVPLAAVARGLGYGVRFERDAKVLALEAAVPAAVVSAAPQTLPPGPYTTFAPIAPATPKPPAASSVPQPRRTPVAEFDPPLAP